MSSEDTISRLSASDLGKPVTYQTQYNPELLFVILREGKRQELGIGATLPFTGWDLWNHYEVSWLNRKGKPIVALAEIRYPCESPKIIESKSMKLYFNSLNQTQYQDTETVRSTIARDLTTAVGMPVAVSITELSMATDQHLYAQMAGICLDHLDITCSKYTVDPRYLQTHSTAVSETLYSHLLKSNCLITNQPDWATVQIQYAGQQIDHAGLLQYLVSLRNHSEFHEQCIERIFMDIMDYCQPEDLLVYGRYTRRGGLDINVLRTKHPITLEHINQRLIRQ